MKPLNTSPDLILGLDHEFKVLLEKVSQLFAEHGLQTRPYRSPDLPFFSRLSIENKSGAFRRLKVFHESLQATIMAGEKITNNSQALWHALKTLSVLPDSDLFAKFENDDVIEYYDTSGTQIWRNFNYMKICSYTFEELMCHDWPTLYIRDEEITHSLIALMVETVSRGERGPKFIDVEFHDCIERFSSDRYQLHVRHNYICPLFDQSKQNAGFIVTSKVKIIASGVAKEAKKEKTQPKLTVIQP